MTVESNETQDTPRIHVEPREADGFDPREIVTRCIESGADGLLLEGPPPAFFDLSSGVAGDLVHRLSLYGIRMAAVVPDVAAHSGPFQDFAREANRGAQFRFATTREEAIRWLERAS